MSGHRGSHHERVYAAHNARIAALGILEGDPNSLGRSRAQREPSPNLDSSPRLSQSGFTVTVLDFGDGIVEARAVFVPGTKRLKAPKDESAEPIERPDNADKAAWRARRAARSLRWRCLALKPTHFLTFTKRGKFGSLEEARATWRKFYKLVTSFKNVNFRYVAVPEMHADGESYHIHVAVDCRYEVSFLRRLWYRALGGRGDEKGQETPGGLNARYMGKHRKDRLRIAGYMAKYLGKSFDGSTNARKAYWCSQGLKPDSVEKVFEPVGDCILVRVRDRVAPLAPKSLWRVFEWSYVGLSGFIMKTC